MKTSSTKTVLLTGTIVGLAIMGDSLLYSLLPINAAELGISLAGVGVLLSANRFTRLISNALAGRLYGQFGQRLPFFSSTLLGVLTTLVYGVGSGFAAFLLARIGWGVAWSGLRQGTYQAAWASPARDRGRVIGVIYGLIRLGSAMSVLAGGLVFDRYGFRASTLAVFAIGTLAIPLSLSVPWPEGQSLTRSSDWKAVKFFAPLNTRRERWLLAAIMSEELFQSTVLVTASLFLAMLFERYQIEFMEFIGVGTVAGLLLAIRYTSNIFIAPLVGSISDRFSQEKTLLVLGVFTLAAILLASTQTLLATIALAAVLFMGAGITVTLNVAGTRLAMNADDANLFMATLDTAWDLAAATGPAVALLALNWVGFAPLYMFTGMLQFTTISLYLLSIRRNQGSQQS